MMYIENLQEKIDLLLDTCSDLQTMELKVTDFCEGKLYIKIVGACSGCAGAEATFRGEIKGKILRTIPEVKEVELDQSMSQELLDFAKSILTKKGG